ncbi:hypothetical protein [Bacteroides heparinolyticus]|uniref:hypothetical protein n=1 Tax=Prevotella heparinolytica TaxID=28113 RepID=UPI0035A1D246
MDWFRFIVAAPVSGDALKDAVVRLLNDVILWLWIIAPVVAIVMIIILFIKKSMASEQEQLTYNNRIRTVVVSVLGAYLASFLIKLLLSYFSGIGANLNL